MLAYPSQSTSLLLPPPPPDITSTLKKAGAHCVGKNAENLTTGKTMWGSGRISVLEAEW